MTNRIQTLWTLLPSSVTVVAVTKTFPFEAVATAHAIGLTHIGENRVEEAREKIEEARRRGFADIMWHMIGHVQSRKAREVAELFDWVDSVDSIELLKKLDGAAGTFHKKLHVLLEVNISGEKSKYGFAVPELESKLKQLKYANLIIEGLMTMAPYVSEAEINRPIFRSMRELSETIRAHLSAFGPHLSMGTSCDYKIAIEEGATQVRLGSALFGPRQ